MMEDAVDRRLASRVIDTMADSLGITILTWRHGPNAEGGWMLAAANDATGERWTVESDRLYAGVCELANQIGFDLDDG